MHYAVPLMTLMTETAAFGKIIARVNNVPSKMSQIWEVFVNYIGGVMP